jgi:hypothetical protein
MTKGHPAAVSTKAPRKLDSVKKLMLSLLVTVSLVGSSAAESRKSSTQMDHSISHLEVSKVAM